MNSSMMYISLHNAPSMGMRCADCGINADSRFDDGDDEAVLDDKNYDELMQCVVDDVMSRVDDVFLSFIQTSIATFIGHIIVMQAQVQSTTVRPCVTSYYSSISSLRYTVCAPLLLFEGPIGLWLT
jgi:hypothetical protein